MFKNILVAAFAAIQLITLPVALARPQLPVTDIRDELEFACAVMQYDCTNVELPEVVQTPLFSNWGALGLYDGHTLYLDTEIMPYFDRVLIDSVIAHELTHYLDYVAKGDEILSDKAHMCASEWNAWRVGNAYVVSHGRPDFADYNWQERYGCTEWAF